VLEKRAERSNTIALVSPLIAIGLTIVTMSILFAILGKKSDLRAWRLFHRSLDDSYSLQEIAVKATPLVMIAIGLSLCYLANVWNIGPKDNSWSAPSPEVGSPSKRKAPTQALGHARDAAARRRGGALYALIPALCKVRFGASEILVSLMLVYVADLFSIISCVPLARSGRVQFPDHCGVRSGRNRAGSD